MIGSYDRDSLGSEILENKDKEKMVRERRVERCETETLGYNHFWSIQAAAFQSPSRSFTCLFLLADLYLLVGCLHLSMGNSQFKDKLHRSKLRMSHAASKVHHSPELSSAVSASTDQSPQFDADNIYIKGRRYQRKNPRYPMPNDEEEQDRLTNVVYILL